MYEMILNGAVTFETCPVCQEPNVKVEHGHSDSGGAMHYWHCPECGNSIAIVCYDCESCKQVKQ